MWSADISTSELHITYLDDDKKQTIFKPECAGNIIFYGQPSTVCRNVHFCFYEHKGSDAYKMGMTRIVSEM